jgi:1,4-alpha-glucan branching enzyme
MILQLAELRNSYGLPFKKSVMKGNLIGCLFLIGLLFCAVDVKAQTAECRIENGRIIFLINPSWDVAQRKEFAKRFEIDSSVMSAVFQGRSQIYADSALWNIQKATGSFIELSKSFVQPTISNLNDLRVFQILSPQMLVQVENPDFGVNNFNGIEFFSYENGRAHFFLQGFPKARKVYLSGSFNGWSTLNTPLSQTDSGWIGSIPLPPGKYTYKYVIDGKWMVDPKNKLRERNEQHEYNSVLYCPNYQFRLKGYPSARRVYLAGNFNDWKPGELAMYRSTNGWILPVYLNDGTHFYKFIVDQEWITDPGNKNIREDSHGNLNSLIAIGDAYVFKLSGFPKANQVILSGTFNNWRTDELLMNKVADGWELPYILPAGNHEYKFIVDGRWILDPANPITDGTGDFQNSVLSFKANHTFSLKAHANAKEVLVSGSFNGWSTSGYRMVKKEGIWTCPVFLRPGKYIYKFVVDGKWMLDPTNALWEDNEFGNGNSVIWINP